MAAVRLDIAYGRRIGTADYMEHETVVDSCGDGSLWNALLSQAAANKTLSRVLLECTRTLICGAGAAGLHPEVITAAHASLAAGGDRLLDKHQGLNHVMLSARFAKGACRPIRILAVVRDVAVHLPRALRAMKVCPN